MKEGEERIMKAENEVRQLREKERRREMNEIRCTHEWCRCNWCNGWLFALGIVLWRTVQIVHEFDKGFWSATWFLATS